MLDGYYVGNMYTYAHIYVRVDVRNTKHVLLA